MDIFTPSQGRSQGDGEFAKRRSAGTGIRFCPECNNMLSARAPRDPSQPLTYHCKNCQRGEETTDNRVYVNILKRTSEQSYLLKRNISDDPCLRKERQLCPKCDRWMDCVLFMAPTLAGEESFQQLWECTYCHNQWKKRAD
jgi:DNA-directed RNA polymerase subunit M/transcription elongation factor TFIIS